MFKKNKDLNKTNIENDNIENDNIDLISTDEVISSEYIDDRSFTLYVPLHDEDAHPYLDDELLIVCDGLGGKGCTKHLISEENKEKVSTASKLKELILKEGVDEEELDKYWNLLVKEIIVDDSPKSSALWASRIVISRFVYAWKYLGLRDSEKLIDFVYKGIEKVQEELELSTRTTGSTMLPSTFVAINYTEEKKRVNCEVMWAGDSRGYVLDNDGLRQLSIDDEDSYGGIVNKFEHGFKTVLNKKTYSFEKPCILFACSDGIFDNRDLIKVESIFLDSLEKSNSMSEFRSELEDFFSKNLQDDCTIALKCFGYPNFKNLKNNFSRRRSIVSSLYENYLEYSSTLELREDDTKYEEIRDKLITRTKDKSQKIKEMILENRNETKDKLIAYLLKDYNPHKESKTSEVQTENQFEEQFENQNKTQFDEQFEKQPEVQVEKVAVEKRIVIVDKEKVYAVLHEYFEETMSNLHEAFIYLSSSEYKKIFFDLLEEKTNNILLAEKASWQYIFGEWVSHIDNIKQKYCKRICNVNENNALVEYKKIVQVLEKDIKRDKGSFNEKKEDEYRKNARIIIIKVKEKIKELLEEAIRNMETEETVVLTENNVLTENTDSLLDKNSYEEVKNSEETEEVKNTEETEEVKNSEETEEVKNSEEVIDTEDSKEEVENTKLVDDKELKEYLDQMFRNEEIYQNIIEEKTKIQLEKDEPTFIDILYNSSTWNKYISYYNSVKVLDSSEFKDFYTKYKEYNKNYYKEIEDENN